MVWMETDCNLKALGQRFKVALTCFGKKSFQSNYCLLSHGEFTSHVALDVLRAFQVSARVISHKTRKPVVYQRRALTSWSSFESH